MKPKVYTIDFETTGIDPKTAHPIEVALYNDAVDYCQLIASPIPVPPETSAIHHITDADLVGMPSWETIKLELVRLVTSSLNETKPILVAHNASYEIAILGDFPYVDWVCTYKCALRVWPDAPSHKNEVLRYWLGLPFLGRSFPQNAHNASHDAEVTFLIFKELLKKVDTETMIAWSKEPGHLPRMPMGKHIGMAWKDVPANYLQWCISQTDMREDVLFCCKRELTKRNHNATSGSRKTY